MQWPSAGVIASADNVGFLRSRKYHAKKLSDAVRKSLNTVSRCPIIGQSPYETGQIFRNILARCVTI
jgi:hypothetical protein